MNLKIKDNLFIIGNRVISYSTEVAKINLKTGEIVTMGTYSRTTGKQLSFLSILSGLALVRSKEPQSFYQYGYGVKCNAAPFKLVKISTTAAQTIFSKLGETRDLKTAAAFSWPELRKKDAETVQSELGWSVAKLKEFGENYSLLKTIGVM